jgi:hypothetical protein
MIIIYYYYYVQETLHTSSTQIKRHLQPKLRQVYECLPVNLLAQDQILRLAHANRMSSKGDKEEQQLVGVFLQEVSQCSLLWKKKKGG